MNGKQLFEKVLGHKMYGHPEFFDILLELAELHSRKNHQYASLENPLGNFERASQISSKLFKNEIKNKPLAIALAYMSKQIDGVFDIVGEGKTDTIEELNDKFKDIAVYSVICMILEKEYKDGIKAKK